MKNTYKKGTLTFFAFRTDNDTWIAACRELGILIENTNKDVAITKMCEQVEVMLETISAEKLPESFLNADLPADVLNDFLHAVQKHDLEDWNKWERKVLDFVKGDLALA